MRAPSLASGLALSLAALLVPAVAADGHVTKPPGKAEKHKRVPLHKRPNIVFVMTDDQTLENLRVMHERPSGCSPTRAPRSTSTSSPTRSAAPRARRC